MNVQFSYQNVEYEVPEKEIRDHAMSAHSAFQKIMEHNGEGNDFLGWVNFPVGVSEQTIDQIERCSQVLANQSDVVVVIGIGGSYLGARAVIEALQKQFKPYFKESYPDLLYAGNNMSEDYLYDLLQVLDNKEYSLIVISKSGTTTEPALAFRILKDHCEKKYGKEESKHRIVAITDRQRGALKTLATREGYNTFIIPDDIGGRYSVLTAVGLLPIAVAGFSIRELLQGAIDMRKYLLDNQDYRHNVAMQYALNRYMLYYHGRTIEMMTSFEPRLFYFIEWYKQLFGESEGKEHKGIFPAGAVFTTDLHSMGQYIQEGPRKMFETVISVQNAHHHVDIPYDENDMDGLNYLQHRSINEINHIAEQGTCMAHVDGDVPNMKITIPELNEYNLGELIFFFEMSCAIGGYMLSINPFNQPGVEAYKHNMFSLLGKPGVTK